MEINEILKYCVFGLPCFFKKYFSKNIKDYNLKKEEFERINIPVVRELEEDTYYFDDGSYFYIEL